MIGNESKWPFEKLAELSAGRLVPKVYRLKIGRLEWGVEEMVDVVPQSGQTSGGDENPSGEWVCHAIYIWA